MLSGMGKQLKFLFLATLATLMVLAGSILQVGEPLMAAQTPQTNCQVVACATTKLADQLYGKYPDIPRATAENTTLLSRFIDYHLDTQARPAQYHLDWELSMADYLDAPYHRGGSKVSVVTSADKQAMQTLSRQQRHELVRSLEQLFNQ
ncbi:hypothetical protein D0962_00170 [Leptolyngbyaceae cyanobacterium CCMR0082]|uniref:Uncharacterized protein n=3 Tax=Adonisia TaxID=2950183 RepID=A0A6M0RYH4_9CYAN|nr:hypothetical protein [Adonisia turfae]NEZ56324.1 hypothetical protein [Adonisia turfae CCMR0081]NEZ61206.1 hypothetical protein [Adonisia turfae CCMR0082]